MLVKISFPKMMTDKEYASSCPNKELSYLSVFDFDGPKGEISHCLLLLKLCQIQVSSVNYFYVNLFKVISNK